MTVLLFSSPAHAACSNPTGIAGQIDFNADQNVLQYCDDGSWMPMYAEHYQANAVTFDGTNDYLSAGAMAGVTDSKNITVSFWFRRNGGFGALQYLFQNDSNRFRIAFNASNQIIITGQNSAGSTVINVYASSTVTDTNWHHLMASFDMENTSNRHLYLDGVSGLGVNAYVNDTIDFTNASTVISDSTTNDINADISDFWVDYGTYIDLSDATNRARFIDTRGKPVWLGDDGSRVTGQKPDIFLTGDTANWHTNKGTGGGFTENGALTDAASDPGGDTASGLLGYWRLDETSGTSAADSKGSNTGTWNGSAELSSMVGRIGSGFVFDGVDDFINVGTSATLKPSLPITISAWVNTNSGAYERVIFRSDYQDDLYTGYWMSVTATGAVTINYGSNGAPASGNRRTKTGATVLNPNQWYHVVGVIRGATDMSIYLNGVDDNGSYGGSGGALAYGSGPSVIGKHDNSNVGPPLYFTGTLDDVRVYNRALSLAEVQQLAGCTSPFGVGGTMIYNQTAHVLQYCDGRHWLAMSEAAGDGGAGCSNPTGIEGKLIYNETYRTMQYCEGDQWIAIGKVDACDGDPAPGTVCNDGSVYAGITPDGTVKMYATRCDAGMTWDGSACTGTRTTMPWNNGTTNYVLTACGTSTTTGEASTDCLATTSDIGAPYTAAKYCYDYVDSSGNADWYLPARDDLTLLNTNKTAIGNFTSTATAYWASGEVNANNARSRRFSDDIPNNVSKETAFFVRCVRK